MPPELFDFLLRLLGATGGRGSVLFAHVPVHSLSLGQVSALHERRDFHWVFMARQMSVSLFEWGQRQADLDVKYDRLLQAFEALQKKFDETSAAMAKSRMDAKEDIDKFKASVSRICEATGAAVVNNRVEITRPFRAEFNGIIESLAARYGDDFESHKQVIVTTNDPALGAEHAPWNAVDFYRPTRFTTAGNAVPAWLMYDLKDRRVKPTGYSIRSQAWAKGGHNMKEWRVEGSGDGNDWKVLDTQENCDKLDGRQVTATWKLVQGNEEFQYLRLVMTGNTWSGSQWMALEGWEIYGTVMS